MSLFKKIAQDPSEGPGKTKTCGTCGGSGKIPVEHPSGDPKKTKHASCSWCNGTGRQHV